jgi:hypothetical protein
MMSSEIGACIEAIRKGLTALNHWSSPNVPGVRILSIAHHGGLRHVRWEAPVLGARVREGRVCGWRYRGVGSCSIPFGEAKGREDPWRFTLYLRPAEAGEGLF